jgi:hypothetical protein
MTKKLNTDETRNDLEGSVFFPLKKQEPAFLPVQTTKEYSNKSTRTAVAGVCIYVMLLSIAVYGIPPRCLTPARQRT